MIILHDHRLIFIKPWKVAGTSFDIALSKFAMPRDVITTIPEKDEAIRARLSFRGPQNHRKHALALLLAGRTDFLGRALRLQRVLWFGEHQHPLIVRRRLGRRLWNGYTKVSIVRDPWDIAVSFYFWMHGDYWNKQGRPLAPFEQWCVDNERLLGKGQKQYMIDEEMVIDRFIRYEHFGDDIAALEREKPGLSGLYDTFSSIRAKTGYRPARGGSTAEMFANAPRADAVVRRAAAFQIERFGYGGPAVGAAAATVTSGASVPTGRPDR